jgi:3D (Asp-Asp-Asp) domain-containing protein
MLKKSFPIIATLLAVVFVWQVYLFFWHNTILIVGGNKFRVPVLVSGTVADILRIHNIRLEPKDIVEPPLDAPAPRPGIVRVIRVDEKLVKEETELPFLVQKETITDDNLRPVRLQKGIQSKIVRDVKVIYHNGKEKYRVILRERTTRKIIKRLALTDEAGNIEKVYDLSTAKKRRMVATAYYPGDPLAWKDGTITFLDLKMQRGIVAVDPRVIPLRTRVYVPGYGYGYAGDTGSAIKWDRIDLGVRNREEEKPWMHRRVTVYILEKAKTW